MHTYGLMHDFNHILSVDVFSKLLIFKSQFCSIHARGPAQHRNAASICVCNNFTGGPTEILKREDSSAWLLWPVSASLGQLI